MLDVLSRRRVLAGLAAAGGVAALPAPAARAAASKPVRRTWLSGVGDPNPAHVVAGGFGRWRGSPCTYARVWADSSLEQMRSIWGLQPYTSGGWTGTLDIACGGPRDGLTWRDAAEGKMDETWTRICRRVAKGWGDLSSVHLSMAHELNGTWYPWSVDADDLSDFHRGWARWHAIVQRELVGEGKRAKVCLNLNSDNVGGVDVQALLPSPDQFDVLGCNFYSMWPDLTHASVWDSSRAARKKDGSPRGVEAWCSFAEDIRKPISFPEWGVHPRQHSDNPYFIERMNGFFAAHAPEDVRAPGPGEIAGEAYFNTWATCQLWPVTEVPMSAERYRSSRWGG